MKTSELTGADLDFWVAQAEGYAFKLYETHADGFQLFALAIPGQTTLGSCGRSAGGEWSENIRPSAAYTTDALFNALSRP